MPDIQIVDGVNVNAGLNINVDEMSVERLPEAEVEKISKERLTELYTKMVKEIFKDLGVDIANNATCFEVCVKRVMRSNLLSSTQLSRWGGYRAILKDTVVAVEVWRQTGMTCIIPAPQLVAFWAALNIRRVRSDGSDEASRNFRLLQMYKYIHAAIHIFPKHQKHFLVNIQPVPEPTITDETVLDYPVVHAPVALPNRWEVFLALGRHALLESNDGEIQHPSFHMSEDEIQELDPTEQNAVRHRLEAGPPSYLTDSDSEDKNRTMTVRTEITRAEVMAKAGDLFYKLAHPLRFANEDMKTQVDEWISEDCIQLLDENNRNRLWTWCVGHSQEWADRIRALPEIYPETVCREEIQREPRLGMRHKGPLSQHLDTLSKIADDPEAVRKWVSHMKPVARAEARFNLWSTDHISMQARITQLQQRDGERTLRMMRQEVASLEKAAEMMPIVAEKLESTSERLAQAMGGFSLTPRKRQRQDAESEGEGEGEGELPRAQFTALLHFFRTVQFGNRKAIKDDAAKLCGSLGVSEQQKEQLIKVFKSKGAN